MNDKWVSLHINDQLVTVPEGTTILEAARTVNIDIPTLCWAENLTPVNVCRLCVVEAEGARTLIQLVLDCVKKGQRCTQIVIAFAITAAWFLNFSIVPMT